jgi:hypothetical protein
MQALIWSAGFGSFDQNARDKEMNCMKKQSGIYSQPGLVIIVREVRREILWVGGTLQIQMQLQLLHYITQHYTTLH